MTEPPLALEAPEMASRPRVIVVLVPAVSVTTRAWLPRGDVATVAPVPMDVMPRRQMKVMSWSMSEVSLTVAVRAAVSQVSCWMVMRLWPRTPLMVPLASWAGRAGRISRTPGRE